MSMQDSFSIRAIHCENNYKIKHKQKGLHSFTRIAAASSCDPGRKGEKPKQKLDEHPCQQPC